MVKHLSRKRSIRQKESSRKGTGGEFMLYKSTAVVIEPKNCPITSSVVLLFYIL